MNIQTEPHKAIIVTGTPGTGKSTFSKKLCAENVELEYFDLNDYIKKNKLYDSFDEELDTFVVDEDVVSEILIPLITSSEKTILVDSHMSHYLDPKYVSLCYVTKCSLGELKKRLVKRGYSEQKIRDNLDAEIFDVCRIDSEEFGHIVEIIRTDGE